MKTLLLAWKFFSNHATKLLGFAQTTIGVLAVADGVFSDKALKWILLVSGLLTAWRGFFNSMKAQEPPPTPGGG